MRLRKQSAFRLTTPSKVNPNARDSSSSGVRTEEIGDDGDDNDDTSDDDATDDPGAVSLLCLSKFEAEETQNKDGAGVVEEESDVEETAGANAEALSRTRELHALKSRCGSEPSRRQQRR